MFNFFKHPFKLRLRRDDARKLGNQLPNDRPVSELPNFDVYLPKPFPEIDVQAIGSQALAQLDMMISAGALDGAHGSLVDALVAELFAPAYEAALVRFNEGLRQIELLDEQAVEVCVKLDDAAEQAAAAAATLEVAADEVYFEHVGHERVKSSREGTVDWDAQRRKRNQHRLLLQADTGILDYVRRTYRGVGPLPVTPIDPSTPTGPTGSADTTN